MVEEIINNNENLKQQWEQLCTQLKNELGEVNFESWIKPMSPGDIKNGKIDLFVPTNFMRNWVVTNYSERIQMLWKSFNENISCC
jgi:chromosomal replication initiator protein